MQLPFFLLFRITASVLAAFWLISRISPFIRGIVVRTMPMRIRISDKSFSYQARITTLVSIILGTMVAGGFYLGLTDLTRGMVNQTTKITTTIPEPGPSGDQTTADSTATDAGNHPAPPPEPPKPEPELAPEPEYEIVQMAAPAPTRITPETYFLQVHAFEEKENAWAQQARLERRLRRRVWVADAGDEYAPYRLLIGPFADRAAAAAYRRQKRLDGFPRPLADMRLYAP